MGDFPQSLAELCQEAQHCLFAASHQKGWLLTFSLLGILWGRMPAARLTLME